METVNLPGNFYEATGKFDTLKTLLYTFSGGLVAVFIGFIYGIITRYNPLVYINFLLLAGVVIVLTILITLVKSGSNSRNSTVNIIVSLTLCFIAWHSHWCFYINNYYGSGFFSALFSPFSTLNFMFYYGSNHQIEISRFGSGGLPLGGGLLSLLYLIEFALFFVPAYFTSKVDYFCEECNNYYTTFTGHVEDAELFKTNYGQSKAGFYGFIEKTYFVKDIKSLRVDPASKPEIIKFEYHYCDKCYQNSLMNIATANLKYDDKRNIELGNEEKLIEGVYVDEETNNAMRFNLNRV